MLVVVALTCAMVILLLLVPPNAVAQSLHLANLCKGHRCEDTAFPILDYDTLEKKCICRGHPCWGDEEGKSHDCESDAYPHLHFSYDASGHLHCGCSAEPEYVAVFLAQRVCPGQTCPDAHSPVLDWDDQQMKCVCRPHPCWNLDGVKHACSDPEFPVLKYREEDKQQGPRPICECTVPNAGIASLHLAQLCRHQACNDPAFPVLDYSRDEERCVCRQHPCFDVNGVHHECLTSSMPFLHYKYEKDGKLTCDCGKHPIYTPPYLAKEICPGQTCSNPEFPVLDWDEHKMGCLCRSHPCWNDNGVTHSCADPKMPVLQYREVDKAEEAKKICECGVRLRGRKYHVHEL